MKQLHRTASQPRTLGALEMRRGTLSLSNVLTFRGQIDVFNGGSITNPALHLVASSTNGNVTATLTVGKTASIRKSCWTRPDLPQDKALAHLLFGSAPGGWARSRLPGTSPPAWRP